VILLDYILDTYAWIEYFLGTKSGSVVKRLITSNFTLITLESSISEIYLWCLREEKDFNKVLNIIKTHSHIGPITLTNWIEAAKIREQQRKTMKDFGLMDAIILAKQREFNAKVVTGDPHFKNQKDVMFLE